MQPLSKNSILKLEKNVAMRGNNSSSLFIIEAHHEIHSISLLYAYISLLYIRRPSIFDLHTAIGVGVETHVVQTFSLLFFSSLHTLLFFFACLSCNVSEEIAEQCNAISKQ